VAATKRLVWVATEEDLDVTDLDDMTCEPQLRPEKLRLC
jgi:hypothetical protein